MQWMNRILAGVVVVAAAFSGTARASEGLTLPKESHVPGGVVLLPIAGGADDPPTVKLGDSHAMVLRVKDHWLAVIGVPLSTEPGPLKVAIESRAEKAKDTLVAI
jgi:hypothetical protein